MFKERNVVMLTTTNNKQPIMFLGNDGKLSLEFRRIPSIIYHIYITSDEEIKEGDFVIKPNNEIHKMSSTDMIHYLDSMSKATKRIIATSYESLFSPRIPKSFIKQFIEEYNEGNIITKVMVEYRNIIPQPEFEKNPEFYGTGMFNKQLPAKSVLKINYNNTINIQQIKTSWNREEVLNLCKQAYGFGIDKKPISKWIKENL